MASTIPHDDPHFTLTIELSVTDPAKRVFKDSYDKEGTLIPRQVSELGRLVLRDGDLEKLLTRGHDMVHQLQPDVY